MAGVSLEKRLAGLEWAHGYRGAKVVLPEQLTVPALTKAHINDLWLYCSLCWLARNDTVPEAMAADAHRQLFRVRVALEKAVRFTAEEAIGRNAADFEVLLDRGFYGASKKQGVSVRMPLATCTPTRLCAGACYAHDAPDTLPGSVVRGVINGIVAEHFEHGDSEMRRAILERLRPQTEQAVHAARREVNVLGDGWTREPVRNSRSAN
jgi:hypothetical protein